MPDEDPVRICVCESRFSIVLDIDSCQFCDFYGKICRFSMIVINKRGLEYQFCDNNCCVSCLLKFTDQKIEKYTTNLDNNKNDIYVVPQIWSCQNHQFYPVHVYDVVQTFLVVHKLLKIRYNILIDKHIVYSIFSLVFNN